MYQYCIYIPVYSGQSSCHLWTFQPFNLFEINTIFRPDLSRYSTSVLLTTQTRTLICDVGNCQSIVLNILLRIARTSPQRKSILGFTTTGKILALRAWHRHYLAPEKKFCGTFIILTLLAVVIIIVCEL